MLINRFLPPGLRLHDADDNASFVRSIPSVKLAYMPMHDRIEPLNSEIALRITLAYAVDKNRTIR